MTAEELIDEIDSMHLRFTEEIVFAESTARIEVIRQKYLAVNGMFTRLWRLAGTLPKAEGQEPLHRLAVFREAAKELFSGRIAFLRAQEDRHVLEAMYDQSGDGL